MNNAGRLHRRLAAVVLTLVAASAPAAAEEVQPAAPGMFTEPASLARISEMVERRTASRGTPSDGFFVDLGANMITGSGWIAAGPGYRRHVFHDRAVFSSSAVLSWRFYTTAEARLAVPGLIGGRANAGVRLLFKDALQVNYFGPGNHSDRNDRSGFRLRTTDLSVYSQWMKGRHVVGEARAGWLGYTDVSRMAGREPGYPDTQQLFTDATTPGLSTQPGFLHVDLSVTADTRDEKADTSRGGVFRASAMRYVDRDTGHFTFNLYELEAAQYVTAIEDRLILAGHVWTAIAAAPTGHEIPFYLMPNLGGKNTLRGFADYRFFDRDMENVSVEARVRVFAHLDVAAFVDTGKVAPRVGALGLSDLHSDVGFGVRLRTRDITFARLDVGTSVEGWHLVFKLDEPFRRKKGPGGLPTVAPFVP